MALRIMRLVLGVLGCLAATQGCGHGGERSEARSGSDPKARTGAPAEIQWVFLTDLEGYLEPCGCQSTSLGGLDRIAAEVAALRTAGTPTALVAVGNTLFEDGGEHQRDNDAARSQELWKAETIVDVLSSLRVDVSLLGPGDLEFGAGTLSDLRERAQFPVYGAADPRGPTAETTLKIGAHTVGIVTFVAADSASAPPIAAWARSAAAAAGRLRAAGAVQVVGLAVLSPRDTRRLAAALQGVDFLVAGGRDRDGASPPESIGSTVLLSGPHHGRGLLVLRATTHQPGGSFADDSEWSRRIREQSRKQQAQELAARIATWEKDKGVDPGALAAQRQRLRSLQASAPVPADDGANRFEATELPIPQQGRTDETTRERMAAYDARVNEHNRTTFADRKPPPVPAGAASYLGAQACAGCHQAAFAWWQRHAHGRAYDTLRERHKEFNLSCVGCHVTGYEQPGGSTVTHNEGLIHVGCESCHGPGSLHVGTDPKRIVAAPAEAVCRQCHNPEHSDLFEFKTYRERLRVPGHGLPAEATP